MVLGRRSGPQAGLVIGLTIASVGLLGILSGSAQAAGRAVQIARQLGFSSRIGRLAAKWAARRGIPALWILATIEIESGGDVRKRGDFHLHPQGASLGLMQVNTVAHGQMLARAGLSRADMFDPDKNMQIGTKLLKKGYDAVRKALRGQEAPLPMSDLVALAYWGPGPTANVLRRGGDVRALNPNRLRRWNDALAQARRTVA